MNIDAIFRQAKKIILKDGEHAPLIIVETINGLYAKTPHRESFNSDNALMKAQGFFHIGRFLAQSETEKAEDVQRMFFISEVWFAATTPEERATGEFRRASQNPARKEALMVYEFDPREKDPARAQRLHVAEIVRAGGTLDLVSFSYGEEQSASSPFLTGLLEGMRYATRSDQEVRQRLTRFVREGEW